MAYLQRDVRITAAGFVAAASVPAG